MDQGILLRKIIYLSIIVEKRYDECLSVNDIVDLIDKFMDHSEIKLLMEQLANERAPFVVDEGAFHIRRCEHGYVCKRSDPALN